MKCVYLLCLTSLLLTCCSSEKTNEATHPDAIKKQLQKLSSILTEAEINDNVKGFLSFYDDSIICMPEYQLTLHGSNGVEIFYTEIFQRQKIKTFQRKTQEIIVLGKTIVEIGTFNKEYVDVKVDTLVIQNGKYWNIWDVKPDGSLKLKGEAFGFFHPIKDPKALTVPLIGTQPDESEILLRKEIPFELKAYNALMEKGVRTRDGTLRSQFFTPDGSFMPFADSTVTGMENIKPYLMAYSSRGNVTIDSIRCYTFEFENFGDHILEYAMFKVRWSVSNFSGRTEGKGIRIWKRQDDNSLRLYREIGTHNHLE